MDLAMDVYIPEDYVRTRYNQKMKQADGRASLNDDVQASDDKKWQQLGTKIVMNFALTGHSRSSSFKDDILFNYFST